jgi:hypothetical protein
MLFCDENPRFDVEKPHGYTIATACQSLHPHDLCTVVVARRTDAKRKCYQQPCAGPVVPAVRFEVSSVTIEVYCRLNFGDFSVREVDGFEANRQLHGKPFAPPLFWQR